MKRRRRPSPLASVKLRCSTWGAQKVHKQFGLIRDPTLCLCVLFFFLFVHRNVCATRINMQPRLSLFVYICHSDKSVSVFLRGRSRITDSDRWSSEGSEILSGSCRGVCVCMCEHKLSASVCVLQFPACGFWWSLILWQQHHCMHDTDSRIYTRRSSTNGDRGSLHRPSSHSPLFSAFPSPQPPPTPFCLSAPESLANQTPDSGLTVYICFRSVILWQWSSNGIVKVKSRSALSPWSLRLHGLEVEKKDLLSDVDSWQSTDG